MRALPFVALALSAPLSLLAAEPADLVVRNATVVTMDAQHRVIKDGAVAVRGGAIAAVGPAAEIASKYTAKQTLDAGGGIVIPGLINTHGHAPMVLFRGIADDLKLMEWLTKYIFPAEGKNVSAPFVRAGTRLAALEMLKSGTTTFVDMYYFEDEIAQAAKEAGIRGVLGETIIEIPGGAPPDNKTLADALAYTDRYLTKWAKDPLIVPAIAPHSVYLVAPDTLKQVRTLADKHGAPILIHVSETQDEQKQVQERFGKSPTAHLDSLGFLRKGVLFAHGVWLSPEDRQIVLRTETGVAHCPQSNMKLASGAAPVKEELAENIRLGLGTDGAASNNDLDMFEEMMTAALLAKHASQDPTAAPAPKVLEMATLGGARALGMEDRIGSLEAGKRADLVVVAVDAARLHPLYDPVSHLVYAAKGADVRHVVVEGKVVVRDRKVLTLDEAAVIAEADKIRAQVLKSLAN